MVELDGRHVPEHVRERVRTEYGPATNPRRVNFFGHFSQGAAAKRLALRRKIERAHEEALLVDIEVDAARAFAAGQAHLTRVLLAGGRGLSGETETINEGERK